MRNIQKQKIIDYFLLKDKIFKNILYSNNIIKKIIDEIIINYLEIPVLENGRGISKILGQCNRISKIIKDELLKINNPRIIGVSEINGIVYDEYKIDDGYIVDNGEEGDMYSSHTALNLYLWDEKYTEIIEYHIDLTNSQFGLKTIDNNYFIENIENLNNKLFLLGDNEPIVYLLDENKEVQDELSFLGYEPSNYFDEGAFIRLLKKEKHIPNDIFPEKVLNNPIINTGILKDYSLDNLIILKDKNMILVNIPDNELDEIYNGKLVNHINYKIIDNFNYNS